MGEGERDERGSSSKAEKEMAVVLLGVGMVWWCQANTLHLCPPPPPPKTLGIYKHGLSMAVHRAATLINASETRYWMELKHQLKAAPPPSPLHPHFHSFSPGVLRSVSPFHLSLRCLHRCLHSILLSQFGPLLFSLSSLYSFRVCFATASPLSSVHLIIYTVLTSHLSVVSFTPLLSALSLFSLSTHPFVLPTFHLPLFPFLPFSILTSI